MRIFTFYRYLAAFVCLLLITPQKIYAQRIYSSNQDSGSSGVCLICNVADGANAADGNLQTYSTINVSLGALAETHQSLIFPAMVPANTPVTIKLGTGDNLLDATVLGGILFQGYNGNTPIGLPVTAATLLSAASGNNQSLVTFAPNLAYDRVRVTLDAGLLGAASSIYLYDAYYGTGPGICNTAIDELHGISSALLGLGLSVGGVANPQLAIDGNLNTASTLNAGVAAVGAFAQQTVIYNSLSVIGDSVRITFSTPQALIDAGVLTGMSIETFNGNTSNNDSRFLNSALLTVRLLDLAAGRRKVTVTFVPANVYDRVQLRLGGGVANALSSLDLYEIEHVIPKPVVTVNNVAVNSAQVCSGSSVTLTATAVANTTYNWYTVPTGGSPIFVGAVLTASPTVNTTYYVEAVRNGCTDGSERTAVAVTVNPIPAVAVVPTNTATICQGQTATFTATAVSGGTVNWYSAATGGTLLFTGNVFTTPILSANANYFAEAVNANGCPAATRTQVSVTVNETPAIAALSPTALAINAGQTATLSVSNPQAGVTYNWYTSATGGTIVHTGPNFTTDPLTDNTTYYVEGVLGACSTPSRAQIAIAVNSGPDVAVTPPTQAVNSGQTATFTATSTVPNAIFDWYTSPTGGTSVFTGSVFTSPAIMANTTYYAEAKNPATGAVSPTRASGAVTLNNTGGGVNPNVTVTPPSQVVNVGQTATFTASSTTPGATFNWYATPTGGAPLFTGPSFNTPPVNGNIIYYAEAKDPVSGNVSTPRATATVTVNGGPGGTAPDVTVTPPTQSVNSGQTAAFMASSTTPGTTFTWYTAPSGGSPIFTGPTFTSPAITANTTYYAESKSPAGVASATRATGAVIINGSGGGTNPDITVTPPARAVNAGQTASFTASSTTPGMVFYWYTTPTGGSPIFQGSTFTTPPVNGNVTYYAEAKDPVSGNASTVRATATVNINPGPDITVTPPTQAVGQGATATFTATSTTPGAEFNWYTTPTGGTPIFTGGTFTTPPVTADVTYYVEAKDPITGAVSVPRASASVGVNVVPNISVVPPTRVVDMGQTTNFTGTSTTPGVQFNWYTTPTGSTPIYTGGTFTTPPVNGNVTYYVEAKNPFTGLTSPRAKAIILLNNANANNVFVPNAFTPNSDGKNDILYIYAPNIKNVKFWVYDQWGELQFQSNNQSSGWDGTFKGRIQPVGVYVYYMEATANDGSLIKKKGTVTLLR
jgi:gliding motility-associated-like protein